MAVIRQLLLSTGGGIISLNQQADQAPNTATILIGLGGTGVNALRTIKTEVYSRLKPDDPKAIVPTYKRIQFLGVDTTRKTRGDVEYDQTTNSLLALDGEEFLFIGDSQLSQKLEEHENLNRNEMLEWFRHEDINDVMFGDAGAGGVRQIGRYLFMNKSKEFSDKLNNQITLAMAGQTNAKLYIHLFAGLSGGTGSGSFLDACYLIKKIAPNATVFGYFFLPDVNLSNIAESNDHVRAYVRKNGYAALQELDYCMQLGKNGGQLSQLYQSNLRYVDWKGAPVKLCHIIGAKDTQGNILEKPYEYAMNVTAEYVMDFLTQVKNTQFSLDQHLENCTSMMGIANSRKEIASEVFYAVIGASCAKIPNREINTYLASTLFTKLTNVKDKLPSESDVNRIAVEAFAPAKNSVSDIYEEILKKLRKDADHNYVHTPLDWKHFHKYRNEEEIQNYYTNQRAAKFNAIEKNKQAMDSNENTQSLINKLHKVLYDEITDVNKGPNYVYGVMSQGRKVNIENIIDGLIAENKNRKNQELIQEDLRLQEYEDAKQECKDKLGGLFVNNKNLYEEYLYRIENYCKHEVNINAYEAMDELLNSLKTKISDAADGYYKKLSSLFNDLLETFKENKSALDSITAANVDGRFVQELISISEIKDNLDKEVKKLDLDGFMSSFMTHLMNKDNENTWLSRENDSKVAKLVNEYFVKTIFKDFANKAITSFLQMKYNTENNSEITNNVYSEWVQPLVSKASPMFPVNPSVSDRLGGYGKIAFISVPDQCDPLQKAADRQFRLDNLYQTKPSGLQDRIYIMSSYCGMPLSAYELLTDLEEEYFTMAYEYGTHYYEGKIYPDNEEKERSFNEWQKLPPVIPVDVITSSSLSRMAKLEARVKEAKSLFNEAIKLEILSDKDWCIYDYRYKDKKDITELIEQVKVIIPKLKKPVDVTSYKVKDVLAEMDRYTTISLSKTTMHLVVDGNDYGKKVKRDAIMFDHFFAAPTYMEKVKELVEFKKKTKKEFDELKELLEAKMGAITQGTKDLTNYSNAIFSGVLSYNSAMISYESDDIFAEPYILCERNEEEYPYYTIPIYQGYENYQKLSIQVKNEITKKVNTLLDDASPQLKEVVEKLNELLSQKKMKIWSQLADDYEDGDEIKEVLRKFLNNYQNWIDML